MRVLLVSVNRVTSPMPAYPLAFDHLRAALSPPHTVRTHDVLADGEAGLADVVSAFRPDLIGVSIRNIDDNDAAECQSFVAEARRIVGHLKATSSAPVVLGGAGFSLFPRELLDTCGADFGIVGDGEQIVALASAIEHGSALGEVAGLVTPDGTARPPQRFAPPAAVVVAEQFAYYRDHGGVFNLETARGCPYRCSYCSYPLIQGHSPRRGEPSATARSARRLEEQGARYLFLTDSVFNADPEHSLAVAAAFQAEGVTIPWGAFFTCRRMPADYFRRLRDAGLSHIEFGTDSLSDRVLSALRKPFLYEDVAAVHQEAVAAGVHVAHFFTLGGPEESPDTVLECLHRADALEQAVHFFFCGIRIYPGTALHERAVREKLLVGTESLLAPIYYQSPEITPEKVRDLVESHRAGRLNWVVGAGDDAIRRRMDRKRAQGKVGPLWEELLTLENARRRLLD